MTHAPQADPLLAKWSELLRQYIRMMLGEVTHKPELPVMGLQGRGYTIKLRCGTVKLYYFWGPNA